MDASGPISVLLGLSHLRHVAQDTVLCELMHDEQVTHSAGVPTVWIAMLAHIDANGLDFASLKHVAIGSSAAPRAMLAGFMKAGVRACHAWDMTETNPIGTMARRQACIDRRSSAPATRRPWDPESTNVIFPPPSAFISG